MIITNLFVGSRYLIDRKLIRETVKKILTEHKITNAQVDVSVVGERKMKTLNEERLEHSGPTDVLSFPLYEKGELENYPSPKEIAPNLGDIFISFPVAVQRAKRYGKKVDEQLCFLLEHGLMHLLGYHHE